MMIDVRFGIDTNLVVYAHSFDDMNKRDRARLILKTLGASAVVPVQVLGEFYRVMTRKLRWTPEKASLACSAMSDAHVAPGTSPSAFSAACELSARHNIPIWDAVIIAVAAEAGCSMLLSEDGHEGFSWAGVLVVNPFATPHHPRLAKHLS